ncbi:hypothetical protein ACFL6F_01695 [Planctomycetota bacterium]
MLSIVDLIERGTFDIETASYLALKIQHGASFITGAVPGGGGKTTVMGALLNLIPPNMEIIPCENSSIIEDAKSLPSPVCALAHEISQGYYYCYIWGEVLREFFTLIEYGHLCATNLHADTLSQTKDQICRENGVQETDFNRIDFFIFLETSGGLMNKTIKASSIMCFDSGRNQHIQLNSETTEQASSEYREYKSLFTHLLKNGINTIEEVRKEIVAM